MDGTNGIRTPQARPRAFDTIGLGGLVAGILDGLDAVIVFGLLGVTPTRIAQHIASGVLGPSSFRGGGSTVALGVMLHFVIAFGASAVYFLASRRIPALVRRPVICGLAFGVAAYFFMNHVVIPLSAVAPSKAPFSLPLFLNGVIGHAVLVGLPIALSASRSARAR